VTGIASNRDALWQGVLSHAWAWGPPIDMKMGSTCACTLMERDRRRSVHTLDEVRPFLSLIGNARFEPICVAPLLGCEDGGAPGGLGFPDTPHLMKRGINT
jgi:hypothetical protein